ncbi:MAG TPA: alkaline phosphatase PafA [Parafilimonas sp.]|nr:alkaline phosphatase PafA [Parafilimonas sp.]
MQRSITFILFTFFALVVAAQNEPATSVQRPKLVIGIVVDQMRWDFLYRYYDKYLPGGGFKRLLGEGFSCENTMIPYTPTLTACGHTSVYTGSVPAIHGITGNDWFDYAKNRIIYCSEDDSVKTIGSNTTAGEMSPRNLLVTTITDELRLATNFQSKVIGIAIKDRGAILPAGHNANAAYWYDNNTGDWITSSYYRDSLPAWVKAINVQKLPDKYYGMDWNTLYPINTYTESDLSRTGLPYSLKQFAGKNYQVIAATPYGNSLTFDMAKAAITGEELGNNNTATDMLTVSLSSTDYIGHANGPNAPETEDCYLRLDKDLGDFIGFLDSKIGKGQYLVFLTADHGAAHVPAFLKAHKIPAGNFDNENVTAALNKLLSEKFHTPELIHGIINYQVYLDRNTITAKKLNKDSVYATVINYLLQDEAIERAFAIDDAANVTLNSRIKEAVMNGYYPQRSGDIQLIYKSQWIDGFLKRGTTHGVWNPYDAHIPLIWFGWNIHQGTTNREVYMTDIAPTVAAMLEIQMPNGSIGHVIKEIAK